MKTAYESLLNNTLTIQLVSEKLMSLSGNINDTTYRETKAPSGICTTNILQLLGDRINFLQERIEQEHKDITIHPIHSRSKRGLLNIVGSASKFLFGTAKEDDVQDLKDHYNRVLTVASQNHQMVTLAFKKINILHDSLQKLLEHTNKLTEIVNKALQGLEQLSDFLILDQALHISEASYNTVMEVNRNIIRNVMDAAHEHVTPSLFPLEDLTK